MPRKAHEKHHSQEKLQKGFIGERSTTGRLISNTLNKSMNKNEKIIMGILVGGILIFLGLSLVVLFGKGKNEVSKTNPAGIAPTPTIMILTTPYPTLPPITDFYMQVNEKMFYPLEVAITKGHAVTILNIGKAATTITPTIKSDGAGDFGTIASGEEKAVTFAKEGVYRYTRTGKPDQTLTITVR